MYIACSRHVEDMVIACGRYGLWPIWSTTKGQRSRSHRNVMYEQEKRCMRAKDRLSATEPFCSRANSLPEVKVPIGTFAPWNFRSLSLSGTFVVVINANCYCFH